MGIKLQDIIKKGNKEIINYSKGYFGSFTVL